MRPASRTLELRVTPAGARLGRLLHVSPSEPVVIASRLRLADGESMAIETVHVREKHVPGLTAADLEEQSFYELLQRPLRDRHRRRGADDRAHRHRRGRVGGARRPAPLARLPLRAGHALADGRDRRVRRVDLPRRSLPARHVALPSAGAATPPAAHASGRRRSLPVALEHVASTTSTARGLLADNCECLA